MNRVKTQYNRRSFLQISAASGGGLMVGFSLFSGCAPKTETGVAIPNEWYDINAYLKIGDTGMVTIYSPNPEIGQNVMTSMPMIVAEELDVPWENVVVEQAPLNTGLYQNQFAGGSLSIRLSWDALRMAGATGRRMLLEAAAKEWQVDVATLTTEAGTIKEIEGERTIGYGEIAGKAVDIEVPEEVELKDVKDFELIGSSRKNVEGPKIVTGKPLFGLDYKRDGMKIAMIEHPPAFGMKLKSFNEAEIKSMPGVTDAFIVDTALEKPDWSDVNAFPQLVAIVGNTTWELMQAKKALKAEWEAEKELEDSAMHAERLDQVLKNGKVEESRVDGNPEAGFKKAVKVIERTYTSPFMAHNCMEPMNFFANVTDDSAELIGPVQTPAALESSVAQLLDLDVEAVTVNMTRMGGGFGRRLYPHFGVEAAAISKKVGGPIKLVYTREDDMTQGTYRPPYKSVYKAGLDADNNIVAFTVRGAGLNDGPVFPNRFPAGAIDNYRAEKLRGDSNISTGAWRAPRSHFTAGAEQSFLDEVAEAAGKDPIDLRLELFERAANNPVGEEYEYDAERYAGVLKLVKEKSNWGKETPGIFRGVAAYFCHFSYVAEVFDIAIVDDEPKVMKVWCAVDCGIVVNPDAATNMIEGGVVDGIGHGMYSTLSFKDGAPSQKNFDAYQMIRHAQAPEEIEVFFVENDIAPTGLGEPGLPPAVGALANALYKATGKRFYNNPFSTAAQGDEVM